MNIFLRGKFHGLKISKSINEVELPFVVGEESVNVTRRIPRFFIDGKDISEITPDTLSAYEDLLLEPEDAVVEEGDVELVAQKIAEAAEEKIEKRFCWSNTKLYFMRLKTRRFALFLKLESALSPVCELSISVNDEDFSHHEI